MGSEQLGGAAGGPDAAQPGEHDDQGQGEAGEPDQQLGQGEGMEAHTRVRPTNALTRCSSSRGLNGLMT